jgi:hypothetical protein
MLVPEIVSEAAVNAGKLLFAQLMDFLPWTSFARSVACYGGDRRVHSFSCAEQYRAMAFAQLAYRESLRDIEACLSAQPAKLYPMGFRSPVRRSTLAEANECRDWRIYAELAQRLMLQARKLYAKESFAVDHNAAAYALDSTTIDLCLSLFPWAHFVSTKSAVKMHTLLDLRGNIPAFIRVTTGDVHDVNILDEIHLQPGAYYVMDRGYLDFLRLYRIHQERAFLVTRAKSNLDASRIYSRPTDKQAGILADQSIALNGYESRKHYPSHLRRIRFRDPQTGKNLVFLTNQFTMPPPPAAPSTKAAGRWNCFSSGSSSTCASRPSMEPAKTRSRRNSGSPSLSSGWSPSSKSASICPAHATHFYKFSPLLCSRKCPFHRHFSKRTTLFH